MGATKDGAQGEFVDAVVELSDTVKLAHGFKTERVSKGDVYSRLKTVHGFAKVDDFFSKLKWQNGVGFAVIIGGNTHPYDGFFDFSVEFVDSQGRETVTLKNGKNRKTFVYKFPTNNQILRQNLEELIADLELYASEFLRGELTPYFKRVAK